ncbi:DUF6942 family protein [Shewanella violacea]|uniref:Uncharacterized protein n=1 Tax=Shewanella violacea (strain JCM 10179 / CIP 106290 / LMG 19151 / DSS12) TaxID=637905 RepID=D4ZJ68_SHEVD|nr:hypothetical protein [Shewanella violacea]BAJ01717.1 conserved hypothetical protein [Shewanella violacea DSS12]
MSKSVSSMLIGNADAQTCYYLPNAPTLPQGWSYRQEDATATLIALNGNHWRKILTIMAKLSSLDADWKNYRDTQLLKDDEQIMIAASELSLTAKRHIIVGAESAAKLNIHYTSTSFNSLDEQDKLHGNGSGVFISPYLDYRQFPNSLIEQLKPYLNK